MPNLKKTEKKLGGRTKPLGHHHPSGDLSSYI